MSKFKRIISLLLAIVSFCVLELANPLQTLAEELNRLPTAEAAVLQEIEEPNSLPSMELQEPSLVAVPSNPDGPQTELYILVYIFVILTDAKGSAPTYAGTVSGYTYQYDTNNNLSKLTCTTGSTT